MHPMLSFLRGFKAFLEWQYWLNPNPVPLGPSLVGGIMSFFGWFVVAGVALSVIAGWLKKRDRLKSQAIGRFSSPVFWTGIFGLLALFFAYEQIPFFGRRLWFLLVFVVFVAWLIPPVLFVARDYPRERRALAEKARFEKWLPKKK